MRAVLLACVCLTTATATATAITTTKHKHDGGLALSSSALLQRAVDAQAEYPSDMLRRAVLHAGDHTARKWQLLMQAIDRGALCPNCTDGEGLTILSLGGSISAGRNLGGINHTAGAFLKREIEGVFPDLKVNFVSGAHSVMGSYESAVCLNYVWDKRVDMVLIDHTINDRSLYGEDDSSGMEMLLRVLNSRYPDAVVIMLLFWGSQTDTKFRVVDPHNHLAAHYGITAISPNDAYGFYKERFLPPFANRESFVTDEHHPHEFVHKFIASSILWSFATFPAAPESLAIQSAIPIYNGNIDEHLDPKSPLCWAAFGPAAAENHRLHLQKGWKFRERVRKDGDTLRTFIPEAQNANYKFSLSVKNSNTSVFILDCWAFDTWRYSSQTRHGVARVYAPDGGDVSQPSRPFLHARSGLWLVATHLSPGVYSLSIEAPSESAEADTCFQGFGLVSFHE